MHQHFNYAAISVRLAAACTVFGLAGAAHAVLIDDFTTGNYSVTLVTPGSSDTAFQDGTMIGGTRTTRLVVESNPLLRNIDLSVGSGFTIVDNGTLADSITRVGYGYVNNGSGGLAVNQLNWDMSAITQFNIDFLSNDLLNNVKIYLGTWNGTGLNLSTISAIAPGGHASSPFTLNVAMSGLVGTASTSDVDVVVLELDNSASGDFAVSSFSAVPEPATMAILGMGVIPFLKKRRRR